MRSRSRVATLLSPRTAAALLALVLAGCSASVPVSSSRVVAAATGVPSPSATISRPAASLHPPVVDGVTWTPEGQLVHGRPATYVARMPGGQVSLLWMDPALLRFRYIPGTKFPEGSPVAPSDNVPSSWVPAMVAAFNGGFELKDTAGGYYYAGRTVRPLRAGLAAFEISSAGVLRVGVWGRDLALSPGAQVVRQNLRPLVDQHVDQASPSDSPAAWGLANGGLIHANRSALGQLDDGSLVFAYGSEVRAWQLGAALVQAHVAEAVMLDMNKSWPGGFTYVHAAGKVVGRRIHPSMYHTGVVYLTRFTKDFVVAEALP